MSHKVYSNGRFSPLLTHMMRPKKFATTYCSQCGQQFGPGNCGFSHCTDHTKEQHMDPIHAATQAASQEITAAFEQFFAGKPARVPYVGCGLTNTLGMQYQPVADAITDILSDGTSKAALMVLLQGVTDIAAFRKVLIADYIDQHADMIAQQRVEFDAPAVYSFVMEGATA